MNESAADFNEARSEHANMLADYFASSSPPAIRKQPVYCEQVVVDHAYRDYAECGPPCCCDDCVASRDDGFRPVLDEAKKRHLFDEYTERLGRSLESLRRWKRHARGDFDDQDV